MPFRSLHRGQVNSSDHHAANSAWTLDVRAGQFQFATQVTLTRTAWLAAIHDDDRAEVEACLARMESGSVTVGACEYRILNHDRWTWVVGRASVSASAPDGSAVMIMGHQIDVSTPRSVRAAMVESERRHLYLLEHLISGITVHDPETLTILYVNPTATRLLGKSKEQLVGTIPAEQTHVRLHLNHSYMPMEETPLLRVKRTGKPCTGAIVGVVAADRGEPLWYEVDAHPVCDDAGQMHEILCSFVDVTARVRAENRSTLLDNRLQRVAASARLGVWDWDLISDRVYFDEEMLRIYGLTAERFAGNLAAWKERVHPDDQAEIFAAVDAAVHGGKPYHVRFRVFRPNGDVRTVDAQAVVDRDADGRPLRMTGFNHDITEQVRVEQHLSIAQQVFEIFMAKAPVLAWFTDEDGRLRFCNHQWALLHRADPAQVLGRTMAELFDPAVAQTYLANNALVLASNRTLETVEPGPRADGSPGTYLITKFPLPPIEGRRIVGGIAFDITDHQQREQELQKAKRAAEEAITKDMFLASISHELRTPMNGILGFSELLLDSQLGQTQHEFVRSIYQSAESLLALINEVLDFNKLASGRFDLVTAPFLLEDLIYDLTDIFRPRLSGSAVELVVDIDPEVPRRLVGDRLRIRQILVNLLGNAVKFTTAGSICLGVRPCPSSDQRDLVELSVTDTGPGIAPEIRARLFQPFVQAKATTHSGSGLGLAITRRLAELMGGTTGADDRLGGGAIFSVRLPLRGDGRGDGRAPEPSESTLEVTSWRILLVDDHELSRSAITRQLQVAKAEVVAVADAGGALMELVRDGTVFSSIIVDQHMPGISGLELIRFIRSNDRLAMLPIIVIGDRSGPLDLTVLEQLNIAAFLHKPARPRQLLEAVVHAVQPEQATSPVITHSLDASALLANKPPPMRILVAEDNPIGRKLIQRMLEDLGMEIHLVGDGLSAVEALRIGGFDVVLMDCQMPEMDGIEATRIYRSGEDPGQRVPIIALTANAFATDRERCLSSGMDDFLAKPVSRSVLTHCLAQWAGRIRLGSAPVLDRERFAEAAHVLSAQGGGELAVIFTATVEPELVRAYAAAESADVRVVERAVHSIKGSCDLSGAVAASSQARILIGDVRAGRHDNVRPALDQLSAALRRAARAMAQAVADASPRDS